MTPEQLKFTRDMASPVGWGVTALDTSPAFVLQYVPALGESGTSTAATVALVQDGDMTFLVDGSAPTGKDAIGTAGVIDTSAAGYDTIGELLDYVDKLGPWRMYAAAALRADGCETLLAKTAASCFGDNGLTFYWDSSAGTQHTMVISGEKFNNNGLGGYQSDALAHCENYLISARIGLEFASDGVGLLRVYSASQRSDGTTLFDGALTDATTTGVNDFNAAGGPDNPLVRSTTGQRLVVRCLDDVAGAGTDDIEGVTECVVSGKTVVTTGTHFITSVNY